MFEPKVAPAGAGKGRITDLHLVGGDFRGCARKLAGAGAPAKPIRRLWGNAKGRFRTQGRFAAATVRGTRWLTADFCTGSEVTVRKGVVGARDLVHNRTVILTAARQRGRDPARARARDQRGRGGATSAVTAVVASAPANTTPPSISGMVAPGSSVTASLGAWSGVPAPTFAVQWQRCDFQGNACAPIAGATSQVYTIQSADVSSTLQVQVVATNAAVAALRLPGERLRPDRGRDGHDVQDPICRRRVDTACAGRRDQQRRLCERDLRAGRPGRAGDLDQRRHGL